jgi:hypothetical protein
MDAREFIQYQFGQVRRLCTAPLQELDEAHVNWAPPGTANAIGAILLHQAGVEDAIVHRLCQGQPSLWDRDGWAARVGVERVPGRDGGWREACGSLALEPVLAYRDAVWAATDAYLAALTDDELRREVRSPFGGQRPIADILALVAVHGPFHAGEVSALKGVQGGRGLPF